VARRGGHLKWLTRDVPAGRLRGLRALVQRKARARAVSWLQETCRDLYFRMLECAGCAGNGDGPDEALAVLEPALEGLDVDAVYVDALLTSDQGAPPCMRAPQPAAGESQTSGAPCHCLTRPSAPPARRDNGQTSQNVTVWLTNYKSNPAAGLSLLRCLWPTPHA